MPIRETLNATPTTLGEVLSNGKRYVVPMFQRDYSWREAEWGELWSDIVAVLDGAESGNHFLGAIVLQPTQGEGSLQVIDGQQRLVTLSVLALAVIARIKRLSGEATEQANNRERAKLLQEQFVSTKDPVSLSFRSRLKLNASDDSFYQTHLVQGIEPNRPKSLKGSERRLYDCYRWFAERLSELRFAGMDGAALAGFLGRDVASRLRFIEIRVEDDETAFTVFETLNARGLSLGTTDLVKNFLFSRAAQGGADDLEHVRLKWERVLRFVRYEDVGSLLFHKMAGEVERLREKRVFVEVKRLVATPNQVFPFLQNLESAAELYAALDDPHDDFWLTGTPDTRRWVKVLSMLNFEQYKPVVLAAYDRLADRPEKVERLLRNIVMISLRATVARVNTGNVQKAYQEAAYLVSHDKLKSPYAIARALAEITPTDDEFRSAFENLEIDPRGRSGRLLRYLLSELEAASGGAPLDFDTNDATVEHILPENPGPDWKTFSHEAHARNVVRLGNLTPLEAKLNRDLGSAGFARKIEVYQRSRYQLTRDISVADWTPEALRARQSRLAGLAIKIWPIPADTGD